MDKLYVHTNVYTIVDIHKYTHLHYIYIHTEIHYAYEHTYIIYMYINTCMRTHTHTHTVKKQNTPINFNKYCQRNETCTNKR